MHIYRGTHHRLSFHPGSWWELVDTLVVSAGPMASSLSPQGGVFLLLLSLL